MRRHNPPLGRHQGTIIPARNLALSTHRGTHGRANKLTAPTMGSSVADALFFCTVAGALSELLRFRRREAAVATTAPSSGSDRPFLPARSESEFTAVAALLGSRGGDSNIPLDTRLKLYGLYKQATAGPCTAAQPSILDWGATAKWTAWSALGALSTRDAEEAYIALAASLGEAAAAALYGSPMER